MTVGLRNDRRYFSRLGRKTGILRKILGLFIPESWNDISCFRFFYILRYNKIYRVCVYIHVYIN